MPLLIPKTVVAGLALALTFGPSAARAHHSFAMFDRTRQVTLVGVVKAFQWTNPHSWVQLAVARGGAEEAWAIEALSPNVLGRQGWSKNTLRPGDRVSVVINPLRDGKAGGNLVSVALADGRVLGGGAE